MMMQRIATLDWENDLLLSATHLPNLLHAL